MRSVVVLPQPEGPSSVTSVPASTVNDTPIDRGDGAVALGHRAQLDRRGRRALMRATRRRARPLAGRRRRSRPGVDDGSAATISTMSTAE